MKARLRAWSHPARGRGWCADLSSPVPYFPTNTQEIISFGRGSHWARKELVGSCHEEVSHQQ